MAANKVSKNDMKQGKSPDLKDRQGRGSVPAKKARAQQTDNEARFERIVTGIAEPAAHNGGGAPMTDTNDVTEVQRHRAKAMVKDGNWWRIGKVENLAPEAPGEEPVTAASVYIYDEIGFGGTTAAQFSNAMMSLDVGQLTVHINSPGGEVWDGVAILNTLRDHPAKVTTVVDGVAASSASFIAMAGDEIVMSRNSELMIHDAWGMAIGNASDLRDLADRLDMHSNNIASIYAERTGGTVEEWREFMRAETWYSADEAVAAGLADRVARPDPDVKVESVKSRFDLSVYNYAGRDKAPTPRNTPRGPTRRPAPPVTGTLSAGHITTGTLAAAPTGTLAPPPSDSQKETRMGDTQGEGVVVASLPTATGQTTVEILTPDPPATTTTSHTPAGPGQPLDPAAPQTPTPTVSPAVPVHTPEAPVSAAPPAATPVAAVSTNQEGAGMQLDPAKLRESFGLRPEASDEEVRAAVVASGFASVTPLGKGAPEIGNYTPPARRHEDPTVVTVDSSVLDQLRKDAASGVEAFQRLFRQERDATITEAINQGKFAPARREHWEKAWDKDPEGTKEAIASLSKGLIPMNGPIGYLTQHTEGAEADSQLYDSLYGAPGQNGKVR